MARFEFRLQGLLGLREAERDARRSELAESLAAQQRLRQQYDHVADEVIRQARDRRHATTSGRLDVDRLRVASQFEQSLRHELQAVARRLQGLEVLLAEQQTALVESQRQVRVLENLRQRDLLQFQAAQQASELRLLDEAGARLRRHAS